MVSIFLIGHKKVVLIHKKFKTKSKATATDDFVRYNLSNY